MVTLVRGTTTATEGMVAMLDGVTITVVEVVVGEETYVDEKTSITVMGRGESTTTECVAISSILCRTLQYPSRATMRRIKTTQGTMLGMATVAMTGGKTPLKTKASTRREWYPVNQVPMSSSSASTQTSQKQMFVLSV